MATNLSEEEGIRTPLLGSRVASHEGPYRPGSAIGVPSTVVEPPNLYRSRWRSIRVMYLTMFLGSVTFTITMSSLWPFLQVLNSTTTASFLGWVVASYSLGQLAASPFFGGWANFRKSSREPLTVSLLLTTLSNVFYMYLQSLPSDNDYYMILARGLIGFSAGNVAVVRSYVSGATTVKERTSSMANLSIFQAMGFILGPVIQAALVPVGFPGLVESAGFHFNMYTAPAFFAVVVAVINLLLLIFVFREHRVYDDEIIADIQSGGTDENKDIAELSNSLQNLEYSPDYVAVISSIFLFFVVLFIFTVFETIGTPLTMHMYAWSKSKATLYQGVTLGVAGVLSIIVFIITKIAVKRFTERYLLLFGFCFCLGGMFVLIPWGHVLPPRGLAPVNPQNSSDTYVGMYAFVEAFLPNESPSTNLASSTNSYISEVGIQSDVTITAIPLGNTTTVYVPEGCPWNYDWCTFVPMIHIAQYFSATVLISIGYPMCNLLSYTIYSKVLGPKPQGLWMGWLTASGSLARTVGPVYVSQVYNSFGPQVTFGSCCGFILLTIVFYLFVFKRLVPFSFKDASLPRFGGSEQQSRR